MCQNIDKETRIKMFESKKQEYQRKIDGIKNSFICEILEMANLSYGDKKKKCQSIKTVDGLYMFLTSDEAKRIMNPIFRNGILTTFREAFEHRNMFDEKLTAENYVENIRFCSAALDMADEILKTF